MQCGRFPNRPLAIGNGADPGFDSEGDGSALHRVAVAAYRVRPVGVGVRVAPGPRLPCHRKFILDVLVKRSQILVADWPVLSNAVGRRGAKVTGMKTRGVPRIVHHRSADSPTRVVGSERHGVGAVDDARFRPVELVRPCFVADPVRVRVPEGARVKADNSPSLVRQTLDQRCTACPATDDDQIDLVTVRETTHVGTQPVVHASSVIRDQPGRFVALSKSVHGWARFSLRSSGVRWMTGPASLTSNGSRPSTCAFLYPRGYAGPPKPISSQASGCA